MVEVLVVQDDTRAPDVGLVAVSVVATLQDLGGDIVWRSTESPATHSPMSVRMREDGEKGEEEALFGDEPSSVVLVLEPRGQAKIADLDVEVVVEEDVAQLQIAMNHALAVHVGDSLQQLHHVKPHLGLR